MTDQTSFELVRISTYKYQLKLPRWIRKFTAKTSFHRAWLQGFTGSFLVSVDERT